jgi:hypothetical protein
MRALGLVALAILVVQVFGACVARKNFSEMRADARDSSATNVALVLSVNSTGDNENGLAKQRNQDQADLMTYFGQLGFQVRTATIGPADPAMELESFAPFKAAIQSLGRESSLAIYIAGRGGDWLADGIVGCDKKNIITTSSVLKWVEKHLRVAQIERFYYYQDSCHASQASLALDAYVKSPRSWTFSRQIYGVFATLSEQFTHGSFSGQGHFQSSLSAVLSQTLSSAPAVKWTHADFFRQATVVQNQSYEALRKELRNLGMNPEVELQGHPNPLLNTFYWPESAKEQLLFPARGCADGQCRMLSFNALPGQVENCYRQWRGNTDPGLLTSEKLLYIDENAGFGSVLIQGSPGGSDRAMASMKSLSCALGYVELSPFDLDPLNDRIWVLWRINELSRCFDQLVEQKKATVESVTKGRIFSAGLEESRFRSGSTCYATVSRRDLDHYLELQRSCGVTLGDGLQGNWFMVPLNPQMQTARKVERCFP